MSEASGPLKEYGVILGSLNPTHPMDGEVDLDGASLNEARMWVGVYRETVALESKVLKTIEDFLPNLSPHARSEAERTNVPLIAGQLQRFKERLALWERRLEELKKLEGG
jgi:hypothetical protein